MGNSISLVMLWLFLFLGLRLNNNDNRMANCLGVNWGTQTIHRLPPKMIVQLLKDNNITKVKLFDADNSILTALNGTDIEVMIAIPNEEMGAMVDYDKAEKWVKSNVTGYNGVNIRYVAVGNEPFLKSYNGSYKKTTFPALQNIQKALNNAGVGTTVKAVVPLNADVYESPISNPVPSAGRFRPDISSQMKSIVQFLNQTNAPFMVNIYPFLSLYYGKGQFPFDYAFFDGSAPLIDNSIQYTNVFDANLDTLVSSLTAIGYPNMTIIVGEIGYPTDGDINANLNNTIRFYNGLLPRLANGIGTPLRPGEIEVYLFALLDEDGKSVLPGNFERHWGIFTYDGQPKFPMSLTGNNTNQSSYLIGAKDVKYLPKQWCVMKNDTKADFKNLTQNVKFACKNADCTSLGYGCSCNSLDKFANASYAFNSYYQNNGQSEDACDFQGLAVVTKQNVSQGTCNFHVQIAYSEVVPPKGKNDTKPNVSQGTNTDRRGRRLIIMLSSIFGFLLLLLLI